MKIRMFGFLVVLALLVAGCAPAAADVPAGTQPPASGNPPAVVEAATATPEAALTADQPQGGESTPEAAPAVATSRGDNLEASDPASVKFGDGKPVLVEFFRFT